MLGTPEQLSSTAFVVRERVEAVEVTEPLHVWAPVEGEPEPPTMHYVYATTAGQLLELRLYADEDVDQWFDDTGYEWPPSVRSQLVSQLPKPDRERRRIVAAGELGHQVDEGIAALLEHNDPPVFYRRASLPHEIRANEKGVPYAALVTVNRMRDRQRHVANWVSATDIPAKPPADVCGIMLESPELHLPPLDTIVEHPVMSRHGISTRRGYARESATYFAPSIPLPSLDAPAHPDDFQLRVALSWFDELLADFVFRSPADKANALAMMLTPIVRPLIDGGVPETNYRLAQVYRNAARILRDYGLDGEGEFPEGDRQMFERYLEVGEGGAISRKYDFNNEVHVPVHPDVTDRLLSAIYGDLFTPDELRESANRHDGTAYLIEIQEERETKAMIEGLRAQFGRWPDAQERIRQHLKTAATADLSGKRAIVGRLSGQRLIAVSQELLSPEKHSKLMSEIEIEYPGWCRNCGTLPPCIGCDVCGPSRRLAYAQEGSGAF